MTIKTFFEFKVVNSSEDGENEERRKRIINFQKTHDNISKKGKGAISYPSRSPMFGDSSYI